MIEFDQLVDKYIYMGYSIEGVTMSNQQNEMIKENIFDMWYEYLILDGWDEHDPETIKEATLRTEEEYIRMD